LSLLIRHARAPGYFHFYVGLDREHKSNFASLAAIG
jgi:hypothetical protein